MNFSIHTREADNGFILDVNITGLRLSKTFKPCHEVYIDRALLRVRLRDIVGELDERLREMIPEKSFKEMEPKLIGEDKP